MLNVGDSVQIAGCSTKKRLLETSSGCDSFDTLMGGGLLNSSIVLIDEYRSRCYGSYLTRAFLADGLHHGHRCFIADPFESPMKSVVDKIPIRKLDKDEPEKVVPLAPTGNTDMKIAWRYEGLQKVSSSIGPSSGNENAYDFSKYTENPAVEVYKEEIFSFHGLYKRLCEIVKENEAHVKTTGRGGPKKNLLRVVIRNVDMEFWEDFKSLGRFLCLLRSLARSSYMVVYLTANSFGVSPENWRILETAADVQIQLKSFNDEEKKTFRHLGSVHGYFYLKNLPRLLSVGTHTPPILDLIFEANPRKGLQIRVMHLPCLMDDPAPTKSGGAGPSCQSIDF